MHSGEVVQRLLLWSKRDGRGLARVECSSASSQQQVAKEVKSQLTPTGISVTEIKLPVRQPAPEIVMHILAQLAQVPSGVVFVTGFATAFEPQVPLETSLRIVNFNREQLISFPLRQVWWMSPVVVETSLHAMPDLYGWFSPKLLLQE